MDAKARRARWGALSGAGAALLAAGLVLANLAAQRLFVRWDWTAGGRYSLSEASRKLVRGLPDPVLFRAYVSDGLPQPHETHARYVADLLKEYRAAARDKVKVEVIDPEGSERLKDDAMKAGVAPARFTQVASDQFQMREGFLGLAIFYQDKQEVLPFIQDPSGLEYEITSRVRKMSRKERKVLGLSTGHREPALARFQEGPGARLAEVFDMRTVELSTAAPAPDVLLIVNPAVEFHPGQLDVLDAWISSGVPTAFFLSRQAVSPQNFRPFPRLTQLDGLLAHYGVRVEEGIALDPQCQQVQIQSRQAGFTVANIINYPAFILSRPEKAHPVSRFLDVLSFPYAHPLTPAPGPGLTVTPLARSSPQSWLPAELFSLDPFSLRPPAPDDKRGPFVLAALVEGSTTSFRDPSRPARPRLAVVGAGSFLDDSVPLPPANADFLANLADWLAQEKDFMSIPSRGPSFHPLRPVPGPARAAVKLMGYFFLPGVIVFGGLGYWRRRRGRRGALQKEWEAAADA